MNKNFKNKRKNTRRTPKPRVPRPIMMNNKLSLIGKSQTKVLNASFVIYAVNSSLSTTYYSLGSSTSTASYSKNLGVTLTGTQEWTDINKLYTMYQLQSISMKITRNSNYAYTSTVISELPPVNIQFSLLGATNSTQVSYSDNSGLINFYENKNLSLNMAFPNVSARCSGVNDISVYGPSFWSPLLVNGIGNTPDVYFNIGFNSNPIFVNTANIGIYPIATVNYTFNVRLGASTTL